MEGFEGLQKYPPGKGLVISIQIVVSGAFKDDEKFMGDYRKGAEHDIAIIARSFQRLHNVYFKPISDYTPKAYDIEKLVTEIIGNDESYKYLIILIGSHGTMKNGRTFIADAEGKYFDVEQTIIAPFYNSKFEKLLGCPKFFIFNNCRGDLHYRLSDNSKSERSDPIEGPVEMINVENSTPRGDIYIMWSTTEYTKSLRIPEDGSPLFQTLCSLIEKKADNNSLDKIEFTRLLKFVQLDIKRKHEVQTKIEDCLGKTFYLMNQDFLRTVRTEEEEFARTKLMTAVVQGLTSEAKLLIDGSKIYGKDKELVNKTDNNGVTPLFEACFYGLEPMVTLLLDSGAEVDRAIPDKSTPLMAALNKFHNDIAKQLIKKGADINKAGGGGSTPLHTAADRNNIDGVIELIRLGADIDKTDDAGLTAAFLAAGLGHTEVTRVLLQKGAQTRGPSRLTILHSAAMLNRHETVEMILNEFNGKLMLDDNDNDFGHTPLTKAIVVSADLRMVTILIDAGAKFIKPCHDITPLEWTRRTNNPNHHLIEKYLKSLYA